MREDKVISALIGLAGACSSNPKTDATDNVVIKALAASVPSQESDDEHLAGSFIGLEIMSLPLMKS